MRKQGWSPKYAALLEHYMNALFEQVLAVVPITILLVLVSAIFFGRSVTSPGELTWGLICAIVGLTIFVDALRMAVMPLGELLGEQLPNRLPLPLVLVVACLLGILCTYAEPAMASLRPLARLVSKTKTPYLHLILNELQEPLIFSVGLGVGFAAVLGTLRFVKGWPIKPLIALTLIPTIVLACYMQWGDPNLIPLIGLAWDCGGVTTGPVTVPILLSLGIGVMKTTKEKEKAKRALQDSINSSSGQQPTLDGFGIVTLASILPVLAVEVLAVVTSFIYTPEDIINAAPTSEIESVTDVSPVREIIFSLRAILPLNIALIILIIFVVRVPFPPLTVFVPSDALAAQMREDGESVHQPTNEMSIFPDSGEDGGPEKNVVAAGTDLVEKEENQTEEVIVSEGVTTAGPAPRVGCFQRTFPHGVGGLLIGVVLGQVGMAIFNVGLTYGFTSIGDQVGMLLPSSFFAVEAEPGSPFYSFSGGVSITIFTVFSLGFLATRAEPALNVLGITVEKLSNGSFTRTSLVYAVCVGVAVGMSAGATKILFGVSVIYFILAKYGVAILLTLEASDDFTCIAWDSAGVTTGPVTVPFVLSTGIGFSKASFADEGFGILTCASVAPIITVLLADLTRRMYAKHVKAQVSVAPFVPSSESSLSTGGEAESFSKGNEPIPREAAAERIVET